MSYIHFTDEQKLRAASVDLEEFLRLRGESLIRSGRDKRLKSDHSVTIRGNEWYDHAARKGGGPITFAQTFYGLSYHDGVHYCIGNGLMTGYGNGKFAPNDTLTRAMLAQILYNKERRPAVSAHNLFEDVAEVSWYAKAVIWGAQNGILEGYGNGKFGPEDAITREQLAVMLWRYAGSPNPAGSLERFADGDQTASWAMEAIRWAEVQGIVQGKGGGILDPKGKATRAEAAAMLQRFMTLTTR